MLSALLVNGVIVKGLDFGLAHAKFCEAFSCLSKYILFNQRILKNKKKNRYKWEKRLTVGDVGVGKTLLEDLGEASLDWLRLA